MSALDFVMERIPLTFTAIGEPRFDDRTIDAARADLATLRAQLAAQAEQIRQLEADPRPYIRQIDPPKPFVHCTECGKEAEQIAAMRALLPTLRREHYTCEDSWYSCSAATGDYACSDDSRAGRPCDCGADAWNARIDAAMERK